jgi:hypothetical protein
MWRVLGAADAPVLPASGASATTIAVAAKIENFFRVYEDMPRS